MISKIYLLRNDMILSDRRNPATYHYTKYVNKEQWSSVSGKYFMHD